MKDLLEDLSVEAKILGAAADKWVQVSLSGEDETVATNLLARDFGFCPITLEKAKAAGALKGYVVNLAESTKELRVDVGIFQPATVYASVPLKHLQAELAGEKDTSLKKLAEMWGFSDNLPLTIKITGATAKGNRLDATLDASQIEKFKLWRDSLLDRLIILGASDYQVKLALEQAGLNRDVIDVDALGMFEHALVCKLGTDAAGLVPRLGRNLHKATFNVFGPRKLLFC